jgi:hypothetical protein
MPSLHHMRLSLSFSKPKKTPVLLQVRRVYAATPSGITGLVGGAEVTSFLSLTIRSDLTIGYFITPVKLILTCNYYVC